MLERRAFLQKVLAGLGLTALASILYPMFRYFGPVAGGDLAKKLVVAKSEVPAGEAKDVIIAGAPAMIINRPQKGYIVLSKVCTHLGCLVEFEKAKNRLLCPCHAGIYDLDGNVVSGPPPKPLPHIALRIEGENLVIG
jgi:cytochrome b6-f complex iron-sulfur subunit